MKDRQGKSSANNRLVSSREPEDPSKPREPVLDFNKVRTFIRFLRVCIAFRRLSKSLHVVKCSQNYLFSIAIGLISALILLYS
jgi:hypothetical protein